MREFLTVGEAERHARNVKASDALLALLRRYHGVEPEPKKVAESGHKPTPKVVKDEAIPSKAYIGETARDDIIKEWCRRQISTHKANWFHIIDEITGSDEASVGAIQRAVCRHYQVSMNDLSSIRRTANVVRPRQVAMYLAKTLTLRSLPEIGRRFGGRDHTTVLHAVRKIEGLIAKDTALATDIELLKAKIGGSYGTQADARPLPRNETRHGSAAASQPAPDCVAEHIA